jgi:hypothetical protein
MRVFIDCHVGDYTSSSAFAFAYAHTQTTPRSSVRVGPPRLNKSGQLEHRSLQEMDNRPGVHANPRMVRSQLLPPKLRRRQRARRFPLPSVHQEGPACLPNLS